MLEVNVEAIRKHIDNCGLKQKVIAEKAGIGESQFCLVLQEKRKLEAGEYASVCEVLKVPMSKFMKKRPVKE